MLRFVRRIKALCIRLLKLNDKKITVRRDLFDNLLYHKYVYAIL